MSKSPNFLVPALGGAALVMGVAYGVASRDYGAARIDTLQAHVEKASAEASVASEQAEAEAQRVAEMEAKIAEIQAAAKMQMASAGGVVREPAPVSVDGYGLGRVALPEEIAAWDVDVLPDGRGLPEGRGDVMVILRKVLITGLFWPVALIPWPTRTRSRRLGPIGPIFRRFGITSTARCRLVRRRLWKTTMSMPSWLTFFIRTIWSTRTLS